MEPIVGSNRQERGVEVYWMEEDERKSDLFTFAELIDMRINALDLLDNPHLYYIDTDKRRILASEKGCCTYV